MGEEKRLWMEAALTVPETLLLVGTSEGVLEDSIAEACKLLGEDIWAWGAAEDADAVESPTSTTTGGFVVSEASKHGYDFGVLLPTTCGLQHTLGNPLFTALDQEQSFRFGSPFHPARRGFGSESKTHHGVEIESTGGDAAAHEERVRDTPITDAGFDNRVNLLAGALGLGGTFDAAHCEITRLVALHREASRVLSLCAAPLGLVLRRDDNDDPDRARAAFLLNAHDARQSLISAASAAAAAEDFLRWRAPGSPRRSNWVSVSRRLVGDARRDVLEAQRAVERMRDAAVLDFFHAWTVLKRAPS